LGDAVSGAHSHPHHPAADCLARAKHRFRAAQPGSGVDAALLDAAWRVHGTRRREILDGPGTAGAVDSPGVIRRFLLPLVMVEKTRRGSALPGRLYRPEGRSN